MSPRLVSCTLPRIRQCSYFALVQTDYFSHTFFMFPFSMGYSSLCFFLLILTVLNCNSFSPLIALANIYPREAMKGMLVSCTGLLFKVFKWSLFYLSLIGELIHVSYRLYGLNTKIKQKKRLLL